MRLRGFMENQAVGTLILTLRASTVQLLFLPYPGEGAVHPPQRVPFSGLCNFLESSWGFPRDKAKNIAASLEKDERFETPVVASKSLSH